MRKLFAILPGLAVALALTARVEAAPTLDFVGGSFVPGTGGVVSYAGGATDLVGTNLNISEVIPTSTPSGVQQSITSGLLNFNTGAYTGSAVNGSGQTVLDFSPGGALNLTGIVPGLGIGPPAQALLFNGTFTGSTSVTILTTGLQVVAGVNLTDINVALATYFGLPSGTTRYDGSLTINFNTLGAVMPNTAFTSNLVTSTDERVTPTPEPASFGMACTALVILSAAGLRKMRKVRKAECV